MGNYTNYTPRTLCTVCNNCCRPIFLFIHDRTIFHMLKPSSFMERVYGYI